MKKLILILAVLLLMLGCGKRNSKSVTLDSSWEDIKKAAKDQTVNMYMWGGSAMINDFMDKKIAVNLKEHYGIILNRVPITDIRDTINQLEVEKKAGKKKGSVDIIWINGENFKTAKENDLLIGAFSEDLPSVQTVVNKSALNYDFGEPVEGFEVPWGEAQFVFVSNSEKVKKTFTSMSELEEWLKKNPGKFSYPAPPDFIGSAFLRHVVYETSGGYENFIGEFDEKEATEKLIRAWEFLNRIEPYLWRKGETYPESSAKLHQLYSNGEIYFTMDYNPNIAPNKIKEGQFPESSRTFVLEKGTLFNNHYLTIPFNSPNLAGAMVVINYLANEEAQVLKANPSNWGDGTILDVNKVSKNTKAILETFDPGESGLSLDILGKYRVPEISSKYVNLIEKEWKEHVIKE